MVLSQGIATIQGYTPTAEGLDEKLAIHYYARVAFIQALLPALAGSSDARVITVLSGGVHSAYSGGYEGCGRLGLGVVGAAGAGAGVGVVRLGCVGVGVGECVR